MKLAMTQQQHDAFNDLYGKYLALEVENRQLRRANAILALPRVTDEQIRETDRALRRILDLPMEDQ